MPYQPTAGAARPLRVAGALRAVFLCPRFVARRHIDLHRVSSAICHV
ncbi:putative leader peptide [Streptomyces sp. NPDC007088]